MNTFNVTMTIYGTSVCVNNTFNRLTEKYHSVKSSALNKLNNELFCQTYEFDVLTDQNKLNDDLDFMNIFYNNICSCDIYTICYEQLYKGYLKLIVDINSIYYLYDSGVSLIEAVDCFNLKDKLSFINTIKSKIENYKKGIDYINVIANIYDDCFDDIDYLMDRLYLFLFDYIEINVD